MSKEGVAAVDRSITILDAFLDAGTRSLTLAELADRTGLYKSTLLRIAASLQKGGLLARGPDGAFQLGPKTLSLGGRYQEAFDLAAVVTPELRALADTTGESASFYVRDGQRRICLFRANAVQHRITHIVPVGTTYDLATGAAGRVLTAFGSDRPEGLQQVRDDLIAVSLVQRTLSETGAVAAPVFGAGDRLVGSVGLTGPINRFGDVALTRFTRELLLSARRLTEALGGAVDRYDTRLTEADPNPPQVS